jgi:polysaccharide biosynthesis/export protein
MARLRRWLLLTPMVLLAGAPLVAQDLEELLAERDEEEAQIRDAEPESGQTEQLGEQEAPPVTSRLPAGQYAERLRLSQDRTVDPDTYIVGPGDVIQLYVWGQFDLSYMLQVDPEGRVVIPTAGSLEATGRTLSEVKKLVFAKAAARYPGVEITVTLASLRYFTVYVTGAVSTEGSMVVEPTTRVSDLIEMAGGFDSKVRRLGVSQRAIELRHVDGTVELIDIATYYATGDMQYNPYLRMGDLVHVGYRHDTVAIHGALNRQGAFEFRPGDTLRKLLVLARGVSGSAPVDEVKLWRFTEKGGKATAIDLVGGTAGGATLDSVLDMPLQPDDMVLMRTRSDWQPKPTVRIGGQVVYRGRYRIVPGQTRLRDVVSAAGGFTEDASLADAVVIRVKASASRDPELERLKSLQAVTGLSEMTPEDRAYLKTKARERRGQLTVDFERLFRGGDEEQNIPLETGDVIYVPELRRTISVSGQVRQPGLVDHLPGATVDDYLELSGGLEWRADRGGARLIRARTGLRVPLDRNLELEPGDEIWVPEKEYHDWWAFTQGTIRTIAETLTLVVLVRSF